MSAIKAEESDSMEAAGDQTDGVDRWQAQERSVWLDDLNEADTHLPNAVEDLPPTATLTIIGAGLTGCSLAHALHRDGRGDGVVVLDARHVCSGASGRNGGILWPDSEVSFEMNTYSKMLSLARSMDGSGDGGLSSGRVVGCDGSVSLVEFPSQVDGQEAGASGEDGDNGEDVLDSVRPYNPQREMHAADGAFRRGWLEPLGCRMHTPLLVYHMARAAGSIRFIEDCVVDAVEPSHDGVRVSTSKGVLRSAKVIVAANGDIPRLIPSLAPHFRLCTNTVIAFADPLPEALRWHVSAVSCGEESSEVYISLRHDHRLVIGGLMDGYASDGLRGGGAGDLEIQEKLLRWLYERFPTIAQAVGVQFDDKDHQSDGDKNTQAPGNSEKNRATATHHHRISHCWSGPLAYTTDNYPVAGSIPGTHSRLLVCGGFGGHGMPRCLGLAEALIQKLLEVSVDESDYLSRCEAGRFF